MSANFIRSCFKSCAADGRIAGLQIFTHGPRGSDGIAAFLSNQPVVPPKRFLTVAPDNLVFLDGANSVKVGDFGLSKALVQDGFANTYIGDTPLHVSRIDAREGVQF
ncbi:hypothetical protein B0H14DRAFT_2598627 [Mycena olivaceomarginata]|nr:hypothetical protein B0H14DRAFT_2598627 [Mycena olivaceomarginata]